MKILIVLNHPAHYFVFKYTVLLLKEKNYEIQYIICNKDILENLLISEGVNYIKINERRKRKQSFFSIAINSILQLLIQDYKLFKLTKKVKPELLLGTDISITHIGKLLKIPSFVFNEDDYEINKFFCKFSYPFATKIISPDVCSVGKYINKKIAYNGFQKMAYLHPRYFSPNFSKIEDIVDINETFFIIRLVSLTSGHDVEGKHQGLNNDILDEIIDLLTEKGRVFINSEKKLEDKYQPYALNILPNKMHHLLAYATLFIGDSQTMCAEAGLLGTPFIRFNDFVGKISYLNELENKYDLGVGISTNHSYDLIPTIIKFIDNKEIKKEWLIKKQKIFAEKIDVAEFYKKIIVKQLDNK
jgi:hypothetical protein